MEDPFFNFGDEVYRMKKHGDIEVGIVSENALDVHSDADSDYENLNLRKGFVRVSWHPRGEQEIISEKEINLADRALMPGHVVRRISPKGQQGLCKTVDVEATVKIYGAPFVIRNVSRKHLLPLNVEAYTVFLKDSWIGEVINLERKLLLSFSNGSKCILNEVCAGGLTDVKVKRAKNAVSAYPFHPGQELIGPYKSFKNAHWISRSKELRHMKATKLVKVTVEEVKVEQCRVKWYSQTCTDDQEIPSVQQLPSTMGFDDFQNSLQIGDKNFYVIRSTDKIVPLDQWKKTVNLSANVDSSTASLKESTNEKQEIYHTVNEFLKIDNEYTNKKTKDSKSKVDKNSLQAKTKLLESFRTQRNKNKGSQLTSKKIAARKELLKLKSEASVLRDYKVDEKIVVETLFTQSKVKVVWQDGTVEENVNSVELIPINHLDENQFFPGDFVEDSRETAMKQQYGVVQKVNHKERTAIISWFKAYDDEKNPQPLFLKEEEMSVYDIKEHPDIAFRAGEIVMRIGNFESLVPNFNAGQVIDLHPSGQIQVWWASGQISYCYPQDLYKVGEYESDKGELWDYSDTTNSSYITESICSVAGIQSTVDENMVLKAVVPVFQNIEFNLADLESNFRIIHEHLFLYVKKIIDVVKQCRNISDLLGIASFDDGQFEGFAEHVKKGSKNTHRLLWHLLQFLNKEGSSLNPIVHSSPNVNSNSLKTTQKADNTSVESDQNDYKQDSKGNEIDLLRKVFASLKTYVQTIEIAIMKRFCNDPDFSKVFNTTSRESRPAEISKEITYLENVGVQDLDNDPVLIQTFQIIDSMPESHKFKMQPHSTCTKGFRNAVKREIELLKTSLPNGIIVKACEDRMDLYSAMIIGPSKTPYEDGLFFFDFHFPEGYPQTPPHCHYWSYCSDRLNPNLYTQGTVCLSLLGTWDGRGSEMWTENSSLLQLLISIQGLILCSEPYFNEPGLTKFKSHQLQQENSRIYNEMVVVRLAQAMAAIALNPPEVFKEEVRKHLAAYANRFLKRAQSYIELSARFANEIESEMNDEKSLSEFKKILYEKEAACSKNCDIN